MILWEKRASPQWLGSFESQLEEIAPNAVTIISEPGRTGSLIQIACRRETVATRLVREFGGRAKAIPKNQIDRWLAQPIAWPLRVGRRMVVVGEGCEQGRFEENYLIIPAAGAFGTGHHPTTAMSLRLLEQLTRNVPPGWRLLDAGTGTGILALAAVRFGAATVVALDNDPQAIRHARANARLNKINGVKFVIASLPRWKSSTEFNFITANLYAEVLRDSLALFRKSLCKGGYLITSGILRIQERALVSALNDLGFRHALTRRRGKWVTLLALRKS